MLLHVDHAFALEFTFMRINSELPKLLDGWCERRAYRLLRAMLGVWPPMNGFTSEWTAVWAGLRHLRAVHGDELREHGEFEIVNTLIADLSQMLFPYETQETMDSYAQRLIDEIFHTHRDE